MANSKLLLAELVRDKIAGGRPNSDFPISLNKVVVRLEMDTDFVVRRYLERNMFRRNYFVGGGLLKSFTLAPVRDSGNRTYYLQLETRPITLDQDRGVFSVTQLSDESDPFDTLKPLVRLEAANDLTLGLECNLPPLTDGWRLRGDRLYLFFGDDSELSQRSNYIVQLVTSARALTDDEPLGISADMEAEIVDATVNYFLGEIQLPIDENSDGVTKK